MVATTRKDTKADTEDQTRTATTKDTDTGESTKSEADNSVADAAAEVAAEATDLDDDNGSAGETEEAEDADGPSPRTRRPWLQYLRRSATPLLLAALIAFSAFSGWLQWHEHQVQQAGQQAQKAAAAYAVVLTSIDSNKVDENFKQVLDGATGEFKDMYTQSSVQLRQLLIDNKATAHGVVVDSAIQSESTNSVVVLVFVDQTVTNMSAPDPRIDRSRIKMTMEKIDGRWRASKVQLL